MKTPRRYELHEHWYPSGPCGKRLIHSHPAGDLPHQHAGTGPASYTIDKDEWRKATGLRGGGRKKFTISPQGEQLPVTALEEWQKAFVIIIVGEPVPPHASIGPGIGPVARLVLGNKLRFAVKGGAK